MTIPPAPEIGGDAYEVAEWLEKVADYLYEHDAPYGSDGVQEALRAFWEANPDTLPERVKEAREKRVADAHERRVQRAAEIEAMKDPNWIFGKDED